MNKQLLLAGVVVCALPAAVQADQIETSGEVGFNIAHSDGTTETTFAVATEVAYGNAFFGMEAETLYKDPTDDAEITFSLGYSFDLGNDVALTTSYARTYLNNSGFDADEVALALDFPLGQDIGATIEAVRDIDGKTTDVSLAAEFPLSDRFTGAALVGHDGTDKYGELGVAFDITDNVLAGVLLEVAEHTKPTFNLGIAYLF